MDPNAKPFLLLRTLAVGVTVAMLAGCGGAPTDLPELGQVSGVVTLDGNPLEGATVTFLPQTGSGNASRAATAADGSYELVYSGMNVGAVIGNHRITIVLGEEGQPEIPEGVDLDNLSEEQANQYLSTGPSLPVRYNDETELVAEISAGPNTVNFELTSE